MDHAGLVLHDQAAGLGNVPPEIAAGFCPRAAWLSGHSSPGMVHGSLPSSIGTHGGTAWAALPAPPGKHDKRATPCPLSARLVVVFVRVPLLTL